VALTLTSLREARPGRQLALIGSLVALTLLIAGLVWYLFVRTDYAVAFGDLQPADATTIIAALDKEKIPYRLAAGGTRIDVPAGKVDEARVRIMGADLPFRGTVGLELFGKSDMGMTDFAQKINYLRAIQGELARTIMAIDGVESARVHLALGEDRVFRNDRIPPKASIMVRMRGGAAPSSATVEGIRRLVSAAVDQLDPDSVVVINEEGALVSPLMTEADGRGVSPVVAERQALAAWYEARIRQALAGLPGAQATDVSVRVVGDLPVGSPAPVFAGPATGDRPYALGVTLTPLGAPDAGKLALLSDAVRKAIRFDAARGDIIMVRPATSPAFAEPQVASGPAWRQTAADPASGSEAATSVTSAIVIAVVAVLSLAALVGAALIVRRSRRRAVLMSTDERIAFTDMLNTLLHEDEARERHAAG